jgi:hypothetical protein
MYKLNRKEGYPLLIIDFYSFCIQLNACFVKPFKTKETLNQYYIEYKEQQYETKLDYVLENGYQSVRDWAYDVFSEWHIDINSTMLLPEFIDNWVIIEKDKLYTYPKNHTCVLGWLVNEDISLPVIFEAKSGTTLTTDAEKFWRVEYDETKLEFDEVSHFQPLPNAPVSDKN